MNSKFLERLLLANLLATCALGALPAFAGCGGDGAAGTNVPDGSTPIDATSPPDAPASDAPPPSDAGIDSPRTPPACDAGIICGTNCCTATAPSTVACSDPGAADNRCLITLAPPQYTGPVRVSGGYVYFLSNETLPNMGISRVPVGGGAVETVVSDPHISLYSSSFAVDANNIYWVDQFSGGGVKTGSIMSMPLAGGQATTLATGQTGPLGIGVNASGVYWLDWLEVINANDAGTVTDTGIIMTLGADGGPSTVAAAPGPPRSLALNASTAYWTAAGTGLPGTVYAATLGGATDGGAAVVATNQSNLAEVTANDLTLAWSNESTDTTFFGGGDLVVQPLQDGGLSGSNGGSAKAVALDVTDVFFSLDTSASNGVVSSKLVSLSEGDVFKGMQNVQGIALDSTSVYISDAVGIRQLTPR